MKDIFAGGSQDPESEWISVSDLMAGLAIIFIFIAIVYIRPLIKQKEQAILEKDKIAVVQNTIRKIVSTWQASELKIYRALVAEFRKDELEAWCAEIDRQTLTVRFSLSRSTSPCILFKVNEAKLEPRFEVILQSFVPRYLSVLSNFRPFIEEVRIEGHTSSEWNEWTPSMQAYLKNMELSQARTRSVLEYSLSLPLVASYRNWVISQFTANGLSSSRPALNAEGGEDMTASRRVEFRVRTNAKEQIQSIIGTIR